MDNIEIDADDVAARLQLLLGRDPDFFLAVAWRSKSGGMTAESDVPPEARQLGMTWTRAQAKILSSLCTGIMPSKFSGVIGVDDETIVTYLRESEPFNDAVLRLIRLLEDSLSDYIVEQLSSWRTDSPATTFAYASALMYGYLVPDLVDRLAKGNQ